MTWEAPEDETWRGEVHPEDESWRGAVQEARTPTSQSAWTAGVRTPDPSLPPMVTIYRAPDAMIAGLIRSLLAERQIPHVRLADASTGVFGFPLHLEIVVPQAFERDALAVIREFVDERAGRHCPPPRGRTRGMFAPLLFLASSMIFALATLGALRWFEMQAGKPPPAVLHAP